MPNAHSNSDHKSLFNDNAGLNPVISHTQRPYRGSQLELSVFNAKTHTYRSRQAFERFDTTREEVSHG